MPKVHSDFVSQKKKKKKKLRMGCHAKAFRLIVCFFPNLCSYSFKRFWCYSVLSSIWKLLAFWTISPWEGLGPCNVIPLFEYGCPNPKGGLSLVLQELAYHLVINHLKFKPSGGFVKFRDALLPCPHNRFFLPLSPVWLFFYVVLKW